MQKLFENWRKYLTEIDDPDTDADDAAELRDIASDIESKSTGMKTIDGLGPGIEITIEEQLPDDVDIYFSEDDEYTRTIEDGDLILKNIRTKKIIILKDGMISSEKASSEKIEEFTHK